MFADPHRNIAGEDSCTLNDLSHIGDPTLLKHPSLALFCSSHAPAGILLAVHDLAQTWRQQGPVIMSGFQSVVEDEALTVMLRGPQPVVLWLARSLYKQVPARLRPALDDGRLLIVSPFADSIRRASRRTAHQRNRLLCAAAANILFAHTEPGSHSEVLARESIAAGKPVWTLAHEANEELIRMGALLYPLQTPDV